MESIVSVSPTSATSNGNYVFAHLGTHSTKTIIEVSGTGRKPWPQKGTGQARHRTKRGPQWRHGAIMHGPKPCSHAIKLNKKVRRLGLKIALTARAAEGKEAKVFKDLVLTDTSRGLVHILFAQRAMSEIGVLFRGVSPGVLMFDRTTHLQLVDFRFEKKLIGERAFTICGMADSLAPEIVQGKGIVIIIYKCVSEL